MLHASKTAYVAVADHRDSHGEFKTGDIVIVDEPALLAVLFGEGSLDPGVTVDSSVFTAPAPPKATKADTTTTEAAETDADATTQPEPPAGSGPSPAARGADRMMTGASRRGGRR